MSLLVYDIPINQDKDVIHVNFPFSELNSDNSPSLKGIIEDNIENTDKQSVLIDFSQVNKIDNNGFATIFYLWRICSNKNIKFAVCGLSEKLKKILLNRRFDFFLYIYDNYNEAIRALTELSKAKEKNIQNSNNLEQIFGNLFEEKNFNIPKYKENIKDQNVITYDKTIASSINDVVNKSLAEEIQERKLQTNFSEDNQPTSFISKFENEKFKFIALDKSYTKDTPPPAEKLEMVISQDTMNIDVVKDIVKNNIVQSPKSKIKPQPLASVVIVENDVILSNLISENLTKNCFKVQTFNDTLSALEFLEFNMVDIIISELDMPHIDGYSFCSIIKKKYKNVYFISLSNNSDMPSKMHAFESGTDDYVVKPIEIRELIARLKVGERIIKNFKHMYSQNIKLEKLVFTDPLTNLNNRRFFQDQLTKEIDRAKRYNNTLGLIYIDIDYFKSINDNYGHLIGDHILKKVAKLLKNSTRQSDIICRIGGEEFVIILPETDSEKSFFTAEKIRTILEKTTFVMDKIKINVTISLGIAIKAPEYEIKVDEFIDLADKALYLAKKEGRNKTIIYDLKKPYYNFQK